VSSSFRKTARQRLLMSAATNAANGIESIHVEITTGSSSFGFFDKAGEL
jgi:hypothetical protein